MKLVASLIVHNELDRYLIPCVDHLLEFCDEIVILDDGSDDGTFQYFSDEPHIHLVYQERGFYQHEGQARQALIDLTLTLDPTHVLAIDADEFISDGMRMRDLLDGHPLTPVWTLCMQEIWRADQYLWTREDGGWCSHEIAGVWMPEFIKNRTMMNRALACGRVPHQVNYLHGRSHAQYAETSILHFGWACAADRDARYQRYVEHDGGVFHASAHLQSIMWPDEKVQLEKMPWPMALTGHFPKLQERANRAATRSS